MLDAQGREIARAVTDHDGRFALQLPGPGSYQLRAKRVGFRPHLSPILTLASGQTLRHRLEIEPIAIDLTAVVVEGERQCDLTARRSGAAVAALWEELREALSAVSWSARDPGYHYDVAVFQRDLSASRRVTHDSTVVVAGQFRSPFRSPAAAELAQHGYVVADGDGWVYSAPDADVLLSDTFLATHCFDTRIGRGATAGLLGLGFAPIRRRDVPDVTGVLWVDRATSELRYLEVDYTALPAALRDTPAGGRVSFRRVPSGAWIVQDWVIRMPQLGAASGAASRHAGGEVLRITKPGGTVIYSRPLATLEGMVFDSTTGAGLAHAIVSLPGTPYSTRTDGKGRFQLEVPFEGTRRITFAHPRLDSLPVVTAEGSVDLRADTAVAVRLAVPSEATLIAWLCPGTAIPADGRVVVGLVRKQSVDPLPRATIVLTWQVLRALGRRLLARASRLTTQTDEAGWYTACGLPLGRPITLHASDATSAAPEVSLTFARGGVTVGVDVGGWQAFVGRIWRQDLDVP